MKFGADMLHNGGRTLRGSLELPAAAPLGSDASRPGEAP